MFPISRVTTSSFWVYCWQRPWLERSFWPKVTLFPWAAGWCKEQTPDFFSHDKKTTKPLQLFWQTESQSLRGMSLLKCETDHRAVMSCVWKARTTWVPHFRKNPVAHAQGRDGPLNADAQCSADWWDRTVSLKPKEGWEIRDAGLLFVSQDSPELTDNAELFQNFESCFSCWGPYLSGLSHYV